MSSLGRRPRLLVSGLLFSPVRGRTILPSSWARGSPKFAPGFRRWQHDCGGKGLGPAWEVGPEGEELVSFIRRYPLITFFVLACALSWWPWVLSCSRPLAHPYRGLRAFPRGASRAGGHPRQDGCGGVTATDGTLARRVAVVRCSAGPTYWGHPYRCSDQRLPARCPAFLLRSRVGWLVDPLADVLHPAPDPRPRRHLGGAGLQRLRPAALANRSLSPVCWPNLGGAVVLLAPAQFFITGFDHWNESVQLIAWTVLFARLYNNTQGSVLLAMLMHAMSNTIGGSFCLPDVLGGGLSESSLAARRAVVRGGDCLGLCVRSGAPFPQASQAGGARAA